mmetsp:Transcript_18819/g.42057  ORF Transcript_18819/g.42057 Transcript_18819/m.42057 type:complete len:166 (-) Transcript_18819:38-535(-)
MERAVIDPAAAWQAIWGLGDGVFADSSPAGNGNSRLNALYWVATRPGAESAALLTVAPSAAAPAVVASAVVVEVASAATLAAAAESGRASGDHTVRGGGARTSWSTGFSHGAALCLVVSAIASGLVWRARLLPRPGEPWPVAEVSLPPNARGGSQDYTLLESPPA